MDPKQIRRARKPVRVQVIKLCDELTELLTANPVDVLTIRTVYHLMAENNDRLQEFDNQMMNALMLTEVEEVLSDDENNPDNREYRRCQEFQRRVRGIQIRVDEVLKPRPSSPASSEYSTAFGGSVSRKKTYRLPKTELKKFGGDTLEWLSWWAQFQKVHEDEELHESDKFQYLSQAMVEKSKAADLLKVFPQTSENYPKAIEALKNRFGKEKVLKRVYVRELLKMIINNSRNSVPISKTYDKLEGHLKALESLGVTADQMDIILFPMVESCLPEDILMAWQRSHNFGRDGSSKNPPKTEFDYMMDFVKQEVENESQRTMAQAGFGISQSNKKNVQNNNGSDFATAASLSVTDKSGCVFCTKNNHGSQDCYKAKTMSNEDKTKIVKESGSCFSCLKKGHRSIKCTKVLNCKICGKRHYEIMCADLQERSQVKSSGSDTSKNSEVLTSTTMTNSNSLSKLILMKTIQVRVQGSSGEEQVVRLLFDEGSQRSFIKTALASYLRCPVIERLSLQNNLFGGVTSEVKTRSNHEVLLKKVNGGYQKKLNLVNEHVICEDCPSIPAGPWISEFAKKKIYFTDIGTQGSEIQILIGSDLWGSLMTGRMVKLQNGLIAVESVFGWTLSGRVPSQPDTTLAAFTISMLVREDRLSELWKLETLGIRDSVEKETEEDHTFRVKKKFQDNLVRDEDGRYVIKLPWISELSKTQLPSNRNISEKRLISATMKLKRQEEYLNYESIFQAWDKEGIIKKVKNAQSSLEHYLPHRPVFKPESLTTPVRPVFDASCKVGRNPSLNQCLEKGPNMLELIPSILLRFRQKEIGTISDIRKAFQMVKVDEEDQKFQKFLWWDIDQKLFMEYQHCRVVFGLNCSPFILAAVLEYHLDRVKTDDVDIAELIKKSIYSDNCVTSLDSEEEYHVFKNRSTAIIAEAKMELRQWERSGEQDTGSTTVLGLIWDKNDDVLSCKLPKDLKTSKVTKRNVLSAVSQIFDPMGFLCPALLLPKLMLQEAWAIELGWDDEWDGNQSDKFRDWCSKLAHLSRIRIPRKAFGGSGCKDIQFHIFSDASQKAYGAIVFVRVRSSYDRVTVQLLMAKSRLAPLQNKNGDKVTIPRLELLGCLVGSRLGRTVEESLSLENVRKFYWTDSTTALAWIQQDEIWGTFVGNRVRQIVSVSERRDWRHVPGPLNPADLPSRGCTPFELAESSWWEGPEWLYKDEDSWPASNEDVNEEWVLLERKKSQITMMGVTEDKKPRFSSYLKNVHVMAWIRRFWNNCRLEKKDRCHNKLLTLQEVRLGERDLIFEIQQHYYRKNPTTANLSVFLDEDGVWHVKTRLTYKDDLKSFKNPVLLPNSDPLVHQMIEYVHKIHCHAGVQFTLGILREKYWIPSGRKTVGRVINKCVICRRHSSKNMTTEPAPLPLKRVETQFAFQTTGVDLAGPVILKGGRKTWIVLYTCAVYRGIYLDVVDSLSTADFLDSLEKFTYVIGRPSHLFSDNGTNFVGAYNLMKKLDWVKLENSMQVKAIRWTFNPPSSPWWGGFWEKLIGSVKNLLRRMLGTAKITKKELESCLAAVSYVINNRPLTTLTEDSDDLIPLTPAMFMRDLPVAGLPERACLTSTELQQSYKKIEVLKRAVKERFRKEYLSILVQKGGDKTSPAPEVGDIVLVGQENKKRYQWPLGRITKLIPGNDGKVRVAEIKTAYDVIVRPLQRLFPLEVSSPKAIVIPENIVPDILSPLETTEDPATIIRTRSGRVVKKPGRYEHWNK